MASLNGVRWILVEHLCTKHNQILDRNIDQTLVNSLRGLLNCLIGGLQHLEACTIVYICNTNVVMDWSV